MCLIDVFSFVWFNITGWHAMEKKFARIWLNYKTVLCFLCSSEKSTSIHLMFEQKLLQIKVFRKPFINRIKHSFVIAFRL